MFFTFKIIKKIVDQNNSGENQRFENLFLIYFSNIITLFLKFLLKYILRILRTKVFLIFKTLGAINLNIA